MLSLINVLVRFTRDAVSWISGSIWFIGNQHHSLMIVAQRWRRLGSSRWTSRVLTQSINLLGMLNRVNLRLRSLLCQLLMNMSGDDCLRLLNRHRVTILVNCFVTVIAMSRVRRQMIIIAIVAGLLHLFRIIAPRGSVLVMSLLWLLSWSYLQSTGSVRSRKSRCVIPRASLLVLRNLR